MDVHDLKPYKLIQIVFSGVEPFPDDRQLHRDVLGIVITARQLLILQSERNHRNSASESYISLYKDSHR